MVRALELPPPSFAHRASGPLVWTGWEAGNFQKRIITVKPFGLSSPEERIYLDLSKFLFIIYPNILWRNNVKYTFGSILGQGRCSSHLGSGVICPKVRAPVDPSYPSCGIEVKSSAVLNITILCK